MRRKHGGNAVIEKYFENSKPIYYFGIRKVFSEEDSSSVKNQLKKSAPIGMSGRDLILSDVS